MSNAYNELYAIAYDELTESGANAIWNIWARMPEQEIDYLYSVLSVDPKLARVFARYYIAQHKAAQSGSESDWNDLANILEVLLSRLEGVVPAVA